jgi:hypothetical protein
VDVGDRERIGAFGALPEIERRHDDAAARERLVQRPAARAVELRPGPAMQLDDCGERPGAARRIDACQQRFAAMAEELDIRDIERMRGTDNRVHAGAFLLRH